MKVRLGVVAASVALCCAVVTFGQERFKWSWEREGGATNRPPARAAASAPAAPSAPATPATAGGGISSSAYDELLKENLSLQKQLGESLKQAKAVGGENTRLSRDAKEMDQRIAQLAQTIQRLESEKAAAEAKAGAAAARQPLKVVEPKSIDEEFSQELAALRQVIADLRGQGAPVSAVPSPTDDVTPGSALYKDMERKNALLQEKLVDVSEERDRAVRLCEQLQRRSERLTTTATDSERDLRMEIASLKTKVAEGEARLRVRTKEADTLSTALEREKRRSLEAKKAYEEMDAVRGELEEMTKDEQRDLHYNMAIVYAKEGKPEKAEAEYLEALRADPKDADIHYNLGILYDDDLGQPDRAVIHYRRYLKLKPDARDADIVRQWLMQLDAARSRR